MRCPHVLHLLSRYEFPEGFRTRADRREIDAENKRRRRAAESEQIEKATAFKELYRILATEV